MTDNAPRPPPPPALLEYAYAAPAPSPRADVRSSLKRWLALGYVAACVIGLIAMGVAMAMSV